MVRRTGSGTTQILSVEDARSRILARFVPLPAVDVPLLDAVGQVLAADVLASQDVPPFDNSAMDGYAVRAGDANKASESEPLILDIVGAVPAGEVASVRIESGQAARIMTGAALPVGADAVIRIEDVQVLAERVEFHRPVRERENVRGRGEDFKHGDVVLSAGAVLGAAEVGVLAAFGLPTAHVHRRPRVGVLSTGDEVVELGKSLEPGQIYDCNAMPVAALARDWGAESVVLGIAGDSLEELRGAVDSLPDLDMIVTTGGVSVGDFDLVRDAMNALGQIESWQVKLKPGKPLAFGTLNGIPLLGLPGNPVAALVSFLQFGRPAIMHMLGRTDLDLPSLEARLTERIENRGGRTLFARGALRHGRRGWEATPVAAQGSAQLSGMLGANSLIVVPEEVEVAEAGSMVQVQLLDAVNALSAS